MFLSFSPPLSFIRSPPVTQNRSSCQHPCPIISVLILWVCMTSDIPNSLLFFGIKIAVRLSNLGHFSEKFSGGFAPSTPTGACSPWTLLAGAPPPTPPPGLRPWTPFWGVSPPRPPDRAAALDPGQPGLRVAGGHATPLAAAASC